VEESALAVDGLLKQLARDREAIFKAGILQVEGMPSLDQGTSTALNFEIHRARFGLD
jgi:hypothetical protein